VADECSGERVRVSGVSVTSERRPENHLLRLIDRPVSFDFGREKLRGYYSETGRPSLDPELLLRILLVGY
jgi:transposase